MSTLKAYLEICKQKYYAGEPIISDSQYDSLEEICEEELCIGTDRGRVKHWYPMYSLKKYYEGEELPKGTFIITPKLDGAAIAIRYFNNSIHSVVTRGNGTHGEDVTHLFTEYNLGKLHIPTELKDIGFYQVTGEVVAPSDIKNARNYAAGALNLKDPDSFSKKDGLTFFAYDYQESPFETYIGSMFKLRDLGFQTVYTHDTYDYPKDGYVYRLEINKEYKELGYTSKHPRGAFAVKERSKGIKTIIKDVVWQTGKSGKVTPVAILEPIDIDGATVSKATLNNPGFIEALQVNIGDSVMVERAGGIIPRIIKKAE